MGSFLRLAKALNKNSKSNNTANYVQTETDKDYQKHLETLTDKELEDLIKTQLEEYRNTDEGKANHLRVSKMTETELSIELMEKLKVR